MMYWEYGEDDKTRERKLYDLSMAYVLAHYDVRKLTEEEFFFTLEASYKEFATLTGVFPPTF